MSGFVVVVVPAAELDIVDAFLWYQGRNAQAADAFRAAVFDTIDQIGAAPLSRPEDGDHNRHRVLRRFPYSVIYELLGDTVTILAVAHHRRKPNYWRSGQP